MENIDQEARDKIYGTEESQVGRNKSKRVFKIHKNQEFIRLLSGSDKDSFEQMRTFGIKTLKKIAKDIPFSEYETIIGYATSLAIKQYDPGKGTNFATYLYEKLRGEVGEYRRRRDSMLVKINGLVNSGEFEGHKVYDHEKGENKIVLIDQSDTPEEAVVRNDLYYRELAAFKMAYSSLPSKMQYFLGVAASSGSTRRMIAIEEGIDEKEVTEHIHNGLSMLLSKVLRSNHLDDQEKRSVMERQGLIRSED